MINKRRIITVLSLIAMTVLILSSLNSVAFGKKVNLKFVFYGSAAEATLWKDLTDDFTRQNPDIALEVIGVTGAGWGEYFDKILVMIAGGQVPDLVRVAIEGTQLFAYRGLALPLDDYIERDKEELGDFFEDTDPVLVDAFQYEGHQYALPFEWNDMVIYYNTKLFEKYGISRPADNWDQNQFLSIAQKLTADLDGDGRPDQYGFTFWNQVSPTITPWTLAFGSDILTPDWTQSNANDPKIIAAMQWLQDLIWKYKVSPVPGNAEAVEIFTNGKVGMQGSGSWGRLAYRNAGFEDFDVLYYPKVETQITGYGVGSFPILKASKNPEEAWTLLKYMTGKKPIEDMARLGWSIPMRRSLAYDPEVMGVPPEHYRIFYDALDNAKPVASPPEYNILDNVWMRYIGLITANEMSAKAACEAIQKELIPVFAEREGK